MLLRSVRYQAIQDTWASKVQLLSVKKFLIDVLIFPGKCDTFEIFARNQSML